jgi:hypothetical protein
LTRDDAITIVSMIANSWPGAAWEADRLEAYVNAISSWDAETTTRAVARAVNKLKYRPSVAELLEFVQIERRSKMSLEEEAALVMPDKQPRPLWVERWSRARAAGDFRLFPEQAAAMDILSRRSPEDFKAYRVPSEPFSDTSIWVEPDSWLDDTLPSLKL